MAITISDISNILQKIIAPRIEEQLPTETIWYDMLSRNSGVTPMANNTFYITLRTARHSGITAVTEGAKLASGKPSWSQANVPAKYVFGTFDISDQAIESAKGDPGALANILVEQSAALRTDFARELNRMFFFDGGGVLAKTAASASSSTTLTLVNWAGLAYNAANAAIMPTKWLAPGMNIRIGSVSATIASVDSDSQVTLTAAKSWNAGDAVTKADGDGNATDEPMGARGIVDDGSVVATLQGISRSSYPWWKAYVDSASAALAESDIVNAYLKAKEYGNPRFIFMNYLLFKKYGTLLTSYKKTVDTKEVLTGGWYGVDFAAGAGKVAVVLDYDCPDQEVYIIDPDSLTLAQLTPLTWLDRGDGILRKVDYATWQGVLRWYGNLAVKCVKANAKMTNKTV
uniref:Phage major capsid protein n=1 Tax=candidate division CPR3 bacterium TaxID=2268181 RepID=A0A7V3JAF7_UNCC3